MRRDTEAALISSATRVDVDAMVKDPDASNGDVFLLFVDITQFDSATGPCSFRGYWDNTPHEYGFEYAGDNALFDAGDGVSSCPILDRIDQNDVVKLWAQSTGGVTYQTQIGGSTSVPSFNVLKAEIVRKE